MTRTAYQQLVTLYNIAKKLTLIDGIPFAKNERTALLEKMVEKAVLHLRSIMVLMEGNRNRIKELDVSLIASAARNIIDITNLYFHIAEHGLSEDEKKLRYLTLYINGNHNIVDIVQKLNFSNDCDRSHLLCVSRVGSERDLYSLPAFVNLSTNEQAQIQSGRKPAFRMQSPNILDKNTESAIFNLLSNSTHGYSMGLGNNSVNNNFMYNTFINVIHLLTISLFIARLYTARTIKDYLDLRKRMYRLLTTEEKKTLNELCLTDDFESYIQQMRSEYNSSFFDFLSTSEDVVVPES